MKTGARGNEHLWDKFPRPGYLYVDHLDHQRQIIHRLKTHPIPDNAGWWPHCLERRRHITWMDQSIPDSVPLSRNSPSNHFLQSLNNDDFHRKTRACLCLNKRPSQKLDYHRALAWSKTNDVQTTIFKARGEDYVILNETPWWPGVSLGRVTR